MKKILITLSGLLFIMLANTGCVTDELGITKSESFTLNFDFGSLNTKATDEEAGNSDGDFNENKINTLDIFFYQGNTLKWHISNFGINYDETNKKATIPITSGKGSLFPGTYDIYVVANAGNKTDLSSIVEEQDNLENLKSLLVQTPDFVGKGGSEAQSDFLMDGKISKMIGLSEPALGTVEMKRVAAKIRMRLTNVNIPGYTQDGTASVRLVHFTHKSVLLEGGVATNSPEWQNTSYKNIETTTSDENGKSTAAPFYTYANDWSSDPSLETYIELLIPLKDENMHTNTYKYRIPVTPKGITGEEAKYMTHLYRNHLYDIDVNVKILGGLNEGSVTLDANYTIQDWSTQEVLIDIKGAHYLVVSETNIVMPNISSYTLTFSSSIANVNLVNGSLKVSYTYVNADTGQETPTPITFGLQYPTVAVQAGVASGTIVITSIVPVNFIPKDFTFSVTNGPFTEKITVRQLPPTYFTSERGNRSSERTSGNWQEGDPPQHNRYMYAITTLAPDGSQVWGFPPLDGLGNTINSAEVAQMISPKFMMASQLGARSATLTYTVSQTNCSTYWEETTINGITKRYDDWRLPTEAEIKYIDDLQHNTYNPQGVVMHGLYYWDAYSANGAYLMKNPSDMQSTSTLAGNRCIRDIKD